MSPYKHRVSCVALLDDDPDDHDLFKEAFLGIDPSISVHLLNDEIITRIDKPFVSPGLLFLDIKMPGIDGFAYLKNLRAAGYWDLPIIMYSTSNHPDQVKKAYELGADLFFRKPYSFTELRNSLAQIISLDWREPGKIKGLYMRYGLPDAFALNTHPRL